MCTHKDERTDLNQQCARDHSRRRPMHPTGGAQPTQQRPKTQSKALCATKHSQKFSTLRHKVAAHTAGHTEIFSESQRSRCVRIAAKRRVALVSSPCEAHSRSRRIATCDATRCDYVSDLVSRMKHLQRHKTLGNQVSYIAMHRSESHSRTAAQSKAIK